MKKPKIEDLGIKIGSPDMVLWTGLVDRTQASIKELNNEIKVSLAVLEMAKLKLKEAEHEFKA